MAQSKLGPCVINIFFPLASVLYKYRALERHIYQFLLVFASILSLLNLVLSVIKMLLFRVVIVAVLMAVSIISTFVGN